VTPDEARSILGVAPGATDDVVRAAYRALLRRHHPDVAGPAATRRAARVIGAYRVLRDQPARTSGAGSKSDGGGAGGRPAPAERDRPPGSSGRTATVPGEADEAEDADEVRTVPLAAPVGTVFAAVREAAEVLGELRYADASSGVLETIVHWDGWPPASLLVELIQQDQQTLATCTLESLTGAAGPPIRRVVAELHRIMTALAE
jgi:curved DNA-binding protein CbpA